MSDLKRYRRKRVPRSLRQIAPGLRNAGGIVMVLGAGRLRSEISNLLSVRLFLLSLGCPAFVLGELLIVSPAMSTLLGLRWRD
jgi:hypothetical protein